MWILIAILVRATPILGKNYHLVGRHNQSSITYEFKGNFDASE